MKEPHSEFILNDDDWAFERIARWLAGLEASIYAARQPLAVEFSPVQSQAGMTFADEKRYKPLEIASVWGNAWDYGWFRFHGEVPTEWKGMPVDAVINLEGEVSLFGPEGNITRRLTWGSAFGVPCQVEDVPLFEACNGGEKVTLLAQAWASSIVGLDQPQDPAPDDPFKGGTHQATVKRAHLCILRPEVKRLLWDVEILLGVARESAPYSVRRAKALRALLDGCIAWQDNPENSAIAREKLQPELARPATSSSLEAIAIGHAHIDTGWLWRVGDTIGKCARTFASQAELIEKYPAYRFGASSAQHYAFIKEYHPELHQRIQKLVKAGRWELQGGMWVEPDTNLPSGESLIRQVLYAQQFFRQEFGVDCAVAWLPDVFGLTAALPQILSKSGIKFLLTKKPHWGRTNRYPNTAFRWAGHDGSEILVHVLPQARDYNGLMRVQDMTAAERGFSEKGHFEKFVYTMGIGDGGGGPSEVHIERALRMASLEGVPRVRFGDSREVFQAFEAGRDKLKKWRGDLYVEGHRGTYTTQARLKADNRKLEILLGQMEHLYCCLPAKEYPKESFLRMWKTVLLHQFHDILPGSGIREMVEESEQSNALVFEELARLRESFATKLRPQPKSVALFNALNQIWKGTISAAEALQAPGNATAWPSQTEPDGRVVTQLEVQPTSFSSLVKSGVPAAASALSDPILENEWLRCVFNENGELLSVVDKENGREFATQERPANRLALYVDRPIDWDAWDIDRFYRDERVETAKSSGAWQGWSGPARSVLVFTLQIGSSTISQRCILAAGSRRIDFETEVRWSERHRMLRVGFPINQPGTIGRCEIQHGFLDRPTHQNTPYEEARFEVPCHRYACLLGSEGGAALLNDCKYGVRIEEDLLELALLRSTTYPDHSADQGNHRFTYSFLPLSSESNFTEVPAEAANLNVTPIAFDGCDSAELRSPLEIDGDPVSLEAVKQTESGQEIVVRLAEVRGQTAGVRISGKDTWRRADLMERPEAALEPGEKIHLRPFEVVTLIGAPQRG
jgi:alpha-mannosidase